MVFSKIVLINIESPRNTPNIHSSGPLFWASAQNNGPEECIFGVFSPNLNGMNILAEEATLSKLFWSPFWKGIYFKKIEFAPGANFFLLEQIPLKKSLHMQKSTQEVAKVVPLQRMADTQVSTLREYWVLLKFCRVYLNFKPFEIKTFFLLL